MYSFDYKYTLIYSFSCSTVAYINPITSYFSKKSTSLSPYRLLFDDIILISLSFSSTLKPLSVLIVTYEVNSYYAIIMWGLVWDKTTKLKDDILKWNDFIKPLIFSAFIFCVARIYNYIVFAFVVISQQTNQAYQTVKAI